jgi:hypothetical protein
MSIGNEVMGESSKRSISDGQKGLLLLIVLFAESKWNSYMNVCAMLAIKDDNDTPMIARQHISIPLLPAGSYRTVTFKFICCIARSKPPSECQKAGTPSLVPAKWQHTGTKSQRNCPC